MRRSIRQKASEVRDRLVGRSGVDSTHDLAQEVRRLEKRVERLERELGAKVREVAEGLQEQRELSQRVAELGDLVAEVVSATVRGDREDLDAALAKYAHGL
jgi:predicted RNase H-like nuclease (RuvC/YqgF family)